MKHSLLKNDRQLNSESCKQLFYNILQILLISWIVNVWIAAAVFAQSNFTPLSAEDVEEREDTLMFSAGMKISGDYRLQVRQFNSGTFPPLEVQERNLQKLSFEHELRIGLRSIFHRNISINAELEILQGPWQDADLRNGNSLKQVPDSQIALVLVRQAFLEYNSNPRNILRAGKHTFNLGDRRGKVFSGFLTGFSQECTIGTWCYQLGTAKIGQHSADWLYYGSLDYPVFHTENEDGSTSHLLDIEIFRILYTERDIPLGKGNGPIFENSTESLKAKDGMGNPWYYDAIEQDYFGILVNWQLSPLNLRFDLTGNQGKRRYHSVANSTESRHSIAGVVSELELSYQLDNQQFGFRGLMASGDEEQCTNCEDNFLRTLHGYHEIVPGTYQGTNFYFNGAGLGLTSGTGLGHSVSNTTMFGGWYHLNLEENSLMYRGGLFQLTRTKPMLNVKNEKVRNIGTEWDNTLYWKWNKNLHTELELNFFMAGDAFNYNDNQRPLESNETVVHLVARIFYSF